jgi:hypothetical protein
MTRMTPGALSTADPIGTIAASPAHMEVSP